MSRRRLGAASGNRGTPRGQSLVEFAFVLPMFLFLVMILFDFGRVVYAQHTITQDAREGLRNAIVSPEYDLDKYLAIRAAALRMSPATGLTAADITGETGDCTIASSGSGPTDPTSPTTCFYPDGLDTGDRVVVNITVSVPIITPIISNISGGQYTVTSTAISYLP